MSVVAVLAAALWWRSEGGRWFVVETPSMGTAMPVGTLVLTSPTTADDVGAGDVVTFRAPDSGTVYTHRVVERVASQGDDARLVTKGDVNDSSDSGSIGDADLVGRVAWSAPGLGWLVKAVPLLVVGGAATWLVSLLLARRHRRGTRMIGASVTLAVVNWLLAPWVGLEKVAQRTPDDGGPGVLVDVISLGLLPVRAEQVDGGATARLRDGELATMHLADRADGAYAVTAALDLAWWGWAALVAVCLVPMALSLLVGPDRDGDTR
ncbi:hypothetical protein GCM10028771_30160 [Nocardioides marmoraquaticus]